jgi:undecaprenyl diphosphate synthase
MLSFLSSKINDYWNSILISLLINGVNLPKRIGIIMDGNRRYAKVRNLKIIQGHTDGMKTLINLLKWSISLNIEELTVFAFSIDNFKRSEEEVNNLMNLFKENFNKFGNDKELLKQGIKICIYGKKDLFDDEIQNIFKNIEEKTKNGSAIKLNVCIGYDSTEEIYQAASKSNKNAKNLRKEFESHLYGGYNCCPDLMIRTSGEIRLSNYLLYQCRFSLVLFINKKWPELSFFDYFKILLRYNYNYNDHKAKLKQLEEDNNFSIE